MADNMKKYFLNRYHILNDFVTVLFKGQLKDNGIVYAEEVLSDEKIEGLHFEKIDGKIFSSFDREKPVAWIKGNQWGIVTADNDEDAKIFLRNYLKEKAFTK
jgi:hypothetical protein